MLIPPTDVYSNEPPFCQVHTEDPHRHRKLYQVGASRQESKAVSSFQQHRDRIPRSPEHYTHL